MLLRFANFVREKYSYIIVSSLIAGVIIGLFTSYPGIILKRLSIALIVLMIASMGFTITLKSFTLALRDLKRFSFGMSLNFIFAPLICYLIALTIPNPDIAAGLILIGAVPCAGMAMVWTGLLNGDVPLAVVIGTGTMILAPFLIPLVMLWLAGCYVRINATAMLINLIYTILMPVLAGIFLRELTERRIDVKKVLPLCPAISALCAVFLMFIAINTSMPIILKNLNLLPLFDYFNYCYLSNSLRFFVCCKWQILQPSEEYCVNVRFRNGESPHCVRRSHYILWNANSFTYCYRLCISNANGCRIL